MRAWFILAILLMGGVASSCSWQVAGDIDLIAYSSPNYKQISEFQYPEYSKNDIVFVRSLNLTVTSDCVNSTITPRIYIVKPNGEKEYFTGLETISLENGGRVFLGLKNSSLKLNKDAISTGIVLKTPGDYLVGYEFYTQSHGGERIDFGGSSVIFNDALLGEYPFQVEYKEDKMRVSTDSLLALGIIFLLLSLVFSIVYGWLAGEQLTIRELVKNSIISIAILFLAFGLTFLIIYSFMNIMGQGEMEVDVFSFINAAAVLFIAIFVAFIGWHFIEKKER